MGQVLLIIRAVILGYYTFLVIMIVYLRAQTRGTSFLGRTMKIPRWAYPLITLACVGFALVILFSVLYVLGLESYTDLLTLPFLQAAVFKYLGLVRIVVGAVFLGGSILNLGSSTRILLPLSSTELKTGGFYSISRNPIYMGLYLSMFGIFLTIPSMVVLLGIIPFLVNNHFRIKMEEEYLEQTFGDDYLRYREKVGRYFLWI